MRRLLRLFRCRFGWCPGHVISGIHDRVIWIGWQCNECGEVRHYEPTRY
jgi:hypothetical protein